MFDYESLRFIWWVLLGLLFIGFAIMDGFDLGVAILLPFVSKNEIERSVLLNTIRPFWEGNQVWIILGAGAIFAAWPFVYAVAFSGPYFAILLLLLTMGIARPVAFKYRTKLKQYLWRRVWDWIVFLSGVMTTLLFGILVGNLLLGLPFYFDQELRIIYSGTTLSLLTPFTLFCGLTALAMLTMHGGIYIALKTDAPIQTRAKQYARYGILVLLFLFLLGGILIANHVVGYKVISNIYHDAPSNPLHKEVGANLGAWLDNYKSYRLTVLAPVLTIGFGLIAFVLSGVHSFRLAFIASALTIAGMIGTVGVSMYPFIIPSSVNFNSSLLIWDASSSRLTLMMMLVASIIFIPTIVLYTSWVYRILRGKVSPEDIEKENQQHVY